MDGRSGVDPIADSYRKVRVRLRVGWTLSARPRTLLSARPSALHFPPSPSDAQARWTLGRRPRNRRKGMGCREHGCDYSTLVPARMVCACSEKCSAVSGIEHHAVGASRAWELQLDHTSYRV